MLRLGFGDPRDLKCNAGQASGRAGALPVDDQRGKRDGMTARTADPNVTASISLPRSETARSRDMGRVEAAQCQSGARQQTQHHGGAAHELLPEQISRFRRCRHGMELLAEVYCLPQPDG